MMAQMDGLTIFLAVELFVTLVFVGMWYYFKIYKDRSLVTRSLRTLFDEYQTTHKNRLYEWSGWLTQLLFKKKEARDVIRDIDQNEKVFFKQMFKALLERNPSEIKKLFSSYQNFLNYLCQMNIEDAVRLQDKNSILVTILDEKKAIINKYQIFSRKLLKELALRLDVPLQIADHQEFDELWLLYNELISQVNKNQTEDELSLIVEKIVQQAEPSMTKSTTKLNFTSASLVE